VRPYVVDGRVDDTVIAALPLATDPEQHPSPPRTGPDHRQAT
jgi:hypothetical protein